MLNQPTSSPMMTRMFGRCPLGACCARAFSTDAAAPKADTAAKLVVASRTLRRLMVCSVLLVFSLIIASLSYDASKTNMARGRIHRLRVARGRTVAAAVARRAKMRAALEDLAGNFDFRQTRIVAVLLTSAAGVFRDAARLGRIGFVLGGPPIRGPFPDIADHVVEPIAVRRECHHRRGTRVTVAIEILVRKSD